MAKETLKSYYFDLSKINEFIFSDFNERSKDVEIVETYSFDENGKQIPISKEVRETKVNDLSKQTIQYDVLKGLIDSLDMVDLDASGNPVNMSFGQIVALNTLQTYGIITK